MSMADNIESFRKLLDWIDEQVKKPENEALQKELVQRYGKAVPMQEISNIEKYLGLDYNLDSAVSSFDYAVVQKYDQSLFDQLSSDFREMMRYRYGTRSHRIDFYEFCKYAHFQLEALTNYFYKVWANDSLDNALSLTKKHNTYSVDKIANCKTIADIPYQYKMYAICNYLDQKTIKYTLSNIVKLRNEVNHRSADKIDNDDDLLFKLEFNKQALSYEEQKKAEFLKWCRSSDWNGCMNAMSSYIRAIAMSPPIKAITNPIE